MWCMRKSLRLALAGVLVFTAVAGIRAQTASPASEQETSPLATSEAQAQDVPADYVIGAEDVLGILVWREAEMSGDVTVRSDGMITLPLVGDLRASTCSIKKVAILLHPQALDVIRKFTCARRDLCSQEERKSVPSPTGCSWACD